MKKKRLPAIIEDPAEPRVRLRLAERIDAERLRLWKNRNKHTFFYQQEITPDQQERWLSEYLERVDDHLYLVEERSNADWTPIGVVGCRLKSGCLDVYNVIRGEKGQGVAKIGAGLRLLCDTAIEEYGLPVTCRVLADNPARAWYGRLGFDTLEERETFNILRYTRSEGR